MNVRNLIRPLPLIYSKTKHWSFKVEIFQGLLALVYRSFESTLTWAERSSLPCFVPPSVAADGVWMCTSTSSVSVAVQSVDLAASKVAQQRRQQQQRHRAHNFRTTDAHQPTRNQVKQIYQQLGPTLFKQAYRMTYHSFKNVLRKLRHGIIWSLLKKKEGMVSPLLWAAITTGGMFPMAQSCHLITLLLHFGILQAAPPMT